MTFTRCLLSRVCYYHSIINYNDQWLPITHCTILSLLKGVVVSFLLYIKTCINMYLWIWGHEKSRKLCYSALRLQAESITIIRNGCPLSSVDALFSPCHLLYWDTSGDTHSPFMFPRGTAWFTVCVACPFSKGNLWHFENLIADGRSSL